MHSIHSLDRLKQAAFLEGLALLSRFYWGPAAGDNRDLLLGTYLGPFESLKSLVDYKPPGILDDLEAVTASFTNEDDIFQSLEQTYVRLFINSREGVAAPLYASCYEPGNAPGDDASLMGPPAVMMKERFESKGLSLGDHINDPPDHLSIELEYLYFLLEKGWRDTDASLLDEAAAFGGQIMLPWVIRFQERLEAAESECRFYHLTTAIICAILRFMVAKDRT